MTRTDWLLRTPAVELAERWHRDGFWDDRTLGDLVAEATSAHPDQAVVVHSRVRRSSGTYGEVAHEARLLAAGLAERGIGPGDVVACQLPNWREAVTVIWAAALLGAVACPIVHFYGRREVDYILERTEVRALVTTTSFGRLSPLEGAEDRPALRDLDVLAVVGAQRPPWAFGYDELLADQPLLTRADVDPGAPALVAYTSGTTSEPKGVVHTHRTLSAEVRQVAQILPTERPRLTGSPVGHVGGMLTGVFVPVVQGMPINLLDVWDADLVLDLMLEYGLAAGSGATFFLTSLLDHPRLTPAHIELMRHVSLGGAAVPEAVARRATSLGISITRNYGATEHPTVTGSRHEDPLQQRASTDGRPMPGVEIRIVDEEGRDLPAGQAGEILSRGPDTFVGYTDPVLTDSALDRDGWYHTEDIGVLDAEGFLTITDRKKDIIIRGGENISAAELEEVLTRLPEVAEVAVVAAPSERFGEIACAVVRHRDPERLLDLEAMREAARRAGLGRQKWPERLEVVTDFPRTPSGKIRKRDLRERLSQEPAAGA